MDIPLNGAVERRVLIVGAGPAGLYAAARLGALRLEAKERGDAVRIILLERNPRPGRKLLVSGSGRCNIAHDSPVDGLLKHYGGGEKTGASARFLKRALHALDTPALLAWFEARGLGFVTEANGKIFPESDRAADVLKILLAEIATVKVELRSGCRLLSLAHLATGGFEALIDEDGVESTIRSDAVLIATGGITYPVTGSRGDGLELARDLGHSVVEARPALAAIFVKDWALKNLSGLSFHSAAFVLRREGKILVEREGDLLITHEGLSGPLILDGSRFLRAGDGIELSFIPSEGARSAASQRFEERLDEHIRNSARGLVKGALVASGLPKSLAEALRELAGVPAEATCASLSRPARRELVRLATAFPVRVQALGGLDTAMVTAGGISLAEVDPATMESRIVPGLYFAGELLDIDGDTGGYNLHAAFATGNLAARGISEYLSRIAERSPTRDAGAGQASS
ncbi:MAG TPA: NAD(P)/FAD-dependent oxidoreductase [Rectinemataceae bacterium]|nr:NAD(P)/FAD-dependent oxidoreductase [Rectinemataceae bacterium]